MPQQWNSTLPASHTHLFSYVNHCLSFAFLSVLAELQIPIEIDLEFCLQVGKTMPPLFESVQFYGKDLKFQELDVHLNVTPNTGIFWRTNVESTLGHLEVAGVAGMIVFTVRWRGQHIQWLLSFQGNVTRCFKNEPIFIFTCMPKLFMLIMALFA